MKIEQELRHLVCAREGELSILQLNFKSLRFFTTNFTKIGFEVNPGMSEKNLIFFSKILVFVRMSFCRNLVEDVLYQEKTKPIKGVATLKDSF